MSEFIAGVYRQRIQAVVEVGGDVQVDITTHGGGRGAEGSYITAVFGVQVMVTMFDLAAARAYVRGWLDPADEWVLRGCRRWRRRRWSRGRRCGDRG